MILKWMKFQWTENCWMRLTIDKTVGLTSAASCSKLQIDTIICFLHFISLPFFLQFEQFQILLCLFWYKKCNQSNPKSSRYKMKNFTLWFFLYLKSWEYLCCMYSCLVLISYLILIWTTWFIMMYSSYLHDIVHIVIEFF